MLPPALFESGSPPEDPVGPVEVDEETAGARGRRLPIDWCRSLRWSMEYVQDPGTNEIFTMDENPWKAGDPSRCYFVPSISAAIVSRYSA